MSGWEDQIVSNTQHTLADILEWTASDFYDDFIRVWGIEAAIPPEGMDHDDWLNVRRIYGLGEQIALLAISLVAKKGVGPSRTAEAVSIAEESAQFEEVVRRIRKKAAESEDPELHDVVKLLRLPTQPSDPRTVDGILNNAIQMAIPESVLPPLSVVADRARKLASYAIRTEHERIRAYLSRVARCYCLDMTTELSVMCRATIAVALEEVVDDDLVCRRRGIRPREHIGLAARIDTAEAEGIVDGACIAALREIKKAGDDAAHVAPGLVAAADDLVELLMVGLKGLFPS